VQRWSAGISGFLFVLLSGCGDSSSASAQNESNGSTQNESDIQNPDNTGVNSGVSSGEGQSAPPNILFIISDDQGLDASAQYDISQDVPNTPVINSQVISGAHSTATIAGLEQLLIPLPLSGNMAKAHYMKGEFRCRWW